MSTVSTRTLAGLAFERGEEFDPALTLPSAPLAEDLALLSGARPLVWEVSWIERRRRRERARRASCAAMPAGIPIDDRAPAGNGRPSRLV